MTENTRKVVLRTLADLVEPGERRGIKSKDIARETELRSATAGRWLSAFAGRDLDFFDGPKSTPVFDIDLWSDNESQRIYQITRPEMVVDSWEPGCRIATDGGQAACECPLQTEWERGVRGCHAEHPMEPKICSRPEGHDGPHAHCTSEDHPQVTWSLDSDEAGGLSSHDLREIDGIGPATGRRLAGEFESLHDLIVYLEEFEASDAYVPSRLVALDGIAETTAETICQNVLNEFDDWQSELDDVEIVTDGGVDEEFLESVCNYCTRCGEELSDEELDAVAENDIPPLCRVYVAQLASGTIRPIAELMLDLQDSVREAFQPIISALQKRESEETEDTVGGESA